MISKALAQRTLEPEVMDDPNLDETLHFAALRSLARLNWWSGSTRIIWEPIWRWSLRHDHPRMRILDIATGSGDLPLALSRRAKLAGMRLEIVGVDISQRALNDARRRVDDEARKVKDRPAIEFARWNALDDLLPDGFEKGFPRFGNELLPLF